ncbi:conserved hypothetical protein [Neospora caninum Liverpool]|uniref:Uncharacterized protein n=1 Tax=Neospora caninum (strain Liverpool) TaxID=572307 RepID=F0VIA4_NEOCL|nr:conserved hypothetical protein [Neospora caninum Liverpool]CBZ53465.1 conserved hypothetical protein [Neospora caninum Liverpool]CEL67452.1 TPA: hypothetical protein BN1204_032520 [Neospora caninum Liverpool]|eukprot:XP_003883497.1 conserved hypothetical protein [Neospora caninum Liverpool]
MSAAVDAQAVPLGGQRVPAGMEDHADWRSLPVVAKSSEPEDLGVAYGKVLKLRTELGEIKKLVTALAPAVKNLIFASDAGNEEEASSSRNQLEEQLQEVEKRVETVRTDMPAAAVEGAATDRAEGWLSESTAELVKNGAEKAAQQARDVVADSANLCRTCLDGASPSAKDRFGDFNLKLNSFTRKLFSEQGKLMDVLKAIRKERNQRRTEPQPSQDAGNEQSALPN